MKKSYRSKHDSWHQENKETRLLEQNQEAKLMKSLQVQWADENHYALHDLSKKGMK